jgi:hypothetical protein
LGMQYFNYTYLMPLTINKSQSYIKKEYTLHV